MHSLPFELYYTWSYTWNCLALKTVKKQRQEKKSRGSKKLISKYYPKAKFIGFVDGIG